MISTHKSHTQTSKKLGPVFALTEYLHIDLAKQQLLKSLGKELPAPGCYEK